MRAMYLACLCAVLSCTLPAARSAAQDSPASPSPAARPAAAAQDIPRPDQLEPGVVTTRDARRSSCRGGAAGRRHRPRRCRQIRQRGREACSRRP